MRYTLFITLYLCMVLPLWAHEAPSGMMYDPECCHNMDCAPVTKVIVNPDGSRTITNKLGLVATFPRNFPNRHASDGGFHACISVRTGLPLCLYSNPGM